MTKRHDKFPFSFWEGGGDNNDNDNDNDADNDCDSNNDNLYKMTTPSLFVCVFVFLPVTSCYPCG